MTVLLSALAPVAEPDDPLSIPSVRMTPLRCMCAYNRLCTADISHLRTYSLYTNHKYLPQSEIHHTFSGNCFSTSDLRRRNKNGRRTLCKRRIMRICSSSESSSFSPVPANGALNHYANDQLKQSNYFILTSSKLSTDLKISGSRKFNSDQSSGRLF